MIEFCRKSVKKDRSANHFSHLFSMKSHEIVKARKVKREVAKDYCTNFCTSPIYHRDM